MKSFNLSWCLHEQLVPRKTAPTKTLYHKEGGTKGTRTPKTPQANELLGLIPESDEQGEKSKTRKKTFAFKRTLTHMFTTQKDGQKNNQEPGNSEVGISCMQMARMQRTTLQANPTHRQG